MDIQYLRLSSTLQILCCGATCKGGQSSQKGLLFMWYGFLSSICDLTDNLFLGGGPTYRSPHEFYPHMHWLLDNARGVIKPCICRYCDPSRSQKQVNEIFPLPPHKESTKGPKGPRRHEQTKKLRGPKGVTIKRGYIINRNSITSGPVTTLGGRWRKHKSIGYKTSHPFQS